MKIKIGDNGFYEIANTITIRNDVVNLHHCGLWGRYI